MNRRNEDFWILLFVRVVMWGTLLITLYGIVFWGWRVEGAPARFVLR